MSSSAHSGSSSSTDSSSDAGSDLAAVGLQVETTLASHALVQGVHIQGRVPIVLDVDASNYRPWCRYFHALFGQYGLGDHIDGSPAKGSSDWVQNDFAIVGWFYNRVSPGLLRTVSTDKDTAYSLWRSIRKVFRDNKDTRVVLLGAEFRNFRQGDLSVLEFCSRMKEKADILDDLGAPVSDKDLVYTILNGLNTRLQHAIPHVTQRRRLPSFLKTRSFLLLEEQRLAENAKNEAAEALFAQARGGARAPSGVTNGTPGGSSSNTSRPATNDTKKAKGQNKKVSSSTSTSSDNGGRRAAPSTTTTFWPGINPYTGMVQAWPMPMPLSSLGSGILGPRPAGSAPQAHVAQQANAGSAPTAQLNPQLLAALSNLSVQPYTNNGGDWFMDTGASSHMTSNSGPADQGDDSPM